MDSLQKHAVFDLVFPDSVQPEQEVVGTKWILKVEADHPLKGRVVVQGWGQVPGIDCGCTYAPVCRIQRKKGGGVPIYMMTELGFEKLFESVPLFGDNTGALHIAGNSTYSPRTKHTALRFFYLKKLIKNGKITIHHVATQKQLTDVGTKFVTKNTHRHLLSLIEAYTTRNGISGATEQLKIDQKEEIPQ